MDHKEEKEPDWIETWEVRSGLYGKTKDKEKGKDVERYSEDDEPVIEVPENKKKRRTKSYLLNTDDEAEQSDSDEEYDLTSKERVREERARVLVHM